MQAEDEGEWVFTGGDGEERGPYSLSQLRKLLGRCAPWHSLLSKLEAGLGWAVQGLQAQVHTTIHAGLHCTPCKSSHQGCGGCRGQLRATDMLHDEEAGVSVQVRRCMVEGAGCRA